MASINVMFVSPVDSADYKLSKAEILRGIVAEKLTTAAQEIFAVVGRTVVGYEEEASGLREEIDRQRRQLEALRQRRQLEALRQPRVALWRIDEPVFEEEEDAEGGELPKEEEQQTYVEDSGSWVILGHAEEEEEEESAEDPVQSTSPDQEDLRDPDHQTTITRGPSVKRRRGRRGFLNLRVCLLEVLAKRVLKSPVQDLRCPRGLQEPDFLDLLRSTFPRMTGQFEFFTADATRKLTPLKLKKPTPEEIQRAIKAAGKGRSALYILAKRPKESLRSKEQLPPLHRNDENRPHASSVESDKADCLSGSSRGQQQVETEEDGEQRGLSDERSALCSAAESQGDEGEEDDRDDDWKPDKNNEALRESEAEPNSSETTRKRRVKTRRRKPTPPSPKASADNSDAPLSCKVCRALCGSTNVLIKHSWSHVDDPERLCGVCGEHSGSAEELRSHLQSHQRTHSCDVCGKCFLTVVGLNRHATLHTGERPHKCEICQKAFMFKSGLRLHRWEHLEEKPHKCDVCNQSFVFKQQLRIHLRSHTGEKPYRCDECGKSVGDFRSLSRHKLVHVGEKRHGCQVCGKRFLTPENMKHHQKIHTDRDRVHLCHVCCKTFHTGGQLNAHLKTHSEEKITCRDCGKGLSSQGALRRHMRIHTGERPYECSVCGRAFNSRSILKGHLKIHSGVKQFVCELCGKACTRKEHLKVHMRTHNGERPYQCTVCNKAFTQSHCLKTHMKSHQGAEQPAEDGLTS